MATAMKSHKLRAYQRTAIESARRALTKSGSCILQMPTGAGKTRSATEIVAHSRGVIWFVCHRQEIERQVAKAFTAAGIDFGIVSPRGEMQPKKRVQIVSVGTLPRRIKRLPVPKLVIWDECHHVAAKSWASIRAKLKDARHLGLTATPERLDGKGLGEWFAELVTGPGIAELIKKGFLSEFRYFAPSDPDLTNAKMQAGDYKKADLGKIMNTPVLIGDAVREYKKNAKGKRALAFCASVEASRALAAKFNQSGIKARHVDGTTPTAERDAAVQDLAAGKIKVLTNVEVFTEGFDLPAIDAVILMRPTKSPTLLLQMIGRGLRKASGKGTALIFDHAGLHRDHAWFADDWHWSLDGGAAKARRKAVARGPRRCPECKEVRASREPVCDCGFEFPTGREIGEFDGVLTEVRGVVPEGCVTINYFACMRDVSSHTPYTWIKRGMPTVGGYVPVIEASAWVEENVSVCPVGYMTKSDFGRRHGVTCGSVSNWVDRGMPIWGQYVPISEGDKWASENVRKKQQGSLTHAEFAKRHNVSAASVEGWVSRGMPRLNGFIVPSTADKWVAENVNLKSSRVRSARLSGAVGYMSLKEFGRRHGKINAQSWVDCGLPITDFGVHIAKGDKWVELHMATNKRALSLVPEMDDGSLSKKEFARRIGINPSYVRALIDRGMPVLPNERIQLDNAKSWASKNIKTPQIHPFWIDDHKEYETHTSFASRLKISQTTVSGRLSKIGLPCASNGWVHIQRGLEWVRDNTDIKIPASAWPKPQKRKRNDTALLAEAA